MGGVGNAAKAASSRRTPKKTWRYGARSCALWREAEGFVFGFDPEVDYAGFLALRGIGILVGEWGEGADGYRDDYAAGAYWGFAVEERETFYRAVVAGGSPIG